MPDPTLRVDPCTRKIFLNLPRKIIVFNRRAIYTAIVSQWPLHIAFDSSNPVCKNRFFFYFSPLFDFNYYRTNYKYIRFLLFFSNKNQNVISTASDPFETFSKSMALVSVDVQRLSNKYNTIFVLFLGTPIRCE